MKLALLSDLHANRQATEAVWAHARRQGFDKMVLLGDLVDYGADPAWVIEFSQARQAEGAIALRGNHDDALREDTTTHMSGHVFAFVSTGRIGRRAVGPDTAMMH